MDPSGALTGAASSSDRVSGMSYMECSSFIRCPADAADRLVELEFAVAGGVPVGCAAAWAVYRDDRRPVLHAKVNHLLTRQAALERRNLALIDDCDIEALPLSADINAGPRSHASKHARLQYRRTRGGCGL